MSSGDDLQVGPLTGTVASGDSLQAFGGTLKVTAFGFITITCKATAPSPRARSSSTDPRRDSRLPGRVPHGRPARQPRDGQRSDPRKQATCPSTLSNSWALIRQSSNCP
ncbi:hypothetical protein SHKM778_77320 [Streptomyces sp. KM77-8]|uniref:DUF5666 domain-containing protein n=1 Tax=Streptomyces haneummycinicus TaxID=3074435 RepID=A0AAT9HVE5_9ACTN